ncbi:MAG: N-acetyltransferase [bacterium]
MNYQIRKPQLADWESYRTHRLKMLQEFPEAYYTSYEENLLFPPEKWENYIQASLDAANSITLGAWDQSRMIGSLTISWSDKFKTKHSAEIVGVGVEKEFQGRGIAAALFEEALKFIKAKPQFSKVNLGVNAENLPAISLYKKFGFQESGRKRQDIKIGERYYDTLEMEMFI